MLRFYGEVLGLPSLGPFPVAGAVQHRFQLGAGMLKLLVLDGGPPADGPGDGIRGGVGLRYWTATVTGLRTLIDACLAGGATIDVPLSTGATTGVSYAVLRDPDGNAFELIER
jgi:catechol 2,3-dioxygenase-like lactoylglutathione lyase family enzyme